MSQEASASMMIRAQRETGGRDDSQRSASSQDTAAFGGLPEALNQRPSVLAQLQLDRSLNRTVQRVYGPKSIATTQDEDQTITDVDIHRPGTRPNVSSSVSGADSSGDVYRHFTNWATMRDALAEKYVGLPLAEATRRSKAARGFPEDLGAPDAQSFMDALKLEMNYVSQAGAMGSGGENESRNYSERTAEAQTKAFPKDRARFQAWVASQLDVKFVADRTDAFNIRTAMNHVLHAIRAILFRARKGGAGYTTMAQNQTVEDVILGTLREFDQDEISPDSLFSYLGGQQINVRTPIAAQDLWQLEEALKAYTPERQEQYKKLTFVAPNGDRLAISADLDIFPDEDAEEQYYDMMADAEMDRLNGNSSDSEDDDLPILLPSTASTSGYTS